MWGRTVFLLLLAACVPAAEAQYSNPTPAANGSKTGSQVAGAHGCPWLTEGTAATALDGDVSVTVNMSNRDPAILAEGSCKFSRDQGPDSLEIVVSKAALPLCPQGSIELKGIGNEATRCSPPGTHGHGVEMISSRVRDLHFTVTLASHRQKGDPKADDPQNDALDQVAEEVAGSLY